MTRMNLEYILSLIDNMRKDRVSTMDVSTLFEYWSNNYDKIFEEIATAPGLKIRIPITNPKQLHEFSRTLPFLCDKIIFSPAPLWCSCHESIESPWPEFVTSSCGRYNMNLNSGLNINSGLSELFNWHDSARYPINLQEAI